MRVISACSPACTTTCTRVAAITVRLQGRPQLSRQRCSRCLLPPDPPLRRHPRSPLHHPVPPHPLLQSRPLPAPLRAQSVRVTCTLSYRQALSPLSPLRCFPFIGRRGGQRVEGEESLRGPAGAAEGGGDVEGSADGLSVRGHGRGRTIRRLHFPAHRHRPSALAADAKTHSGRHYSTEKAGEQRFNGVETLCRC